VKYDFFHISLNPLGSFVNDLVDNNDGTVTDKATGLMWQKSGSSTRLGNHRANIYIKRLNQERFAGHSGWRMPTVEELASLLARKRQSGVHLAPVFDYKQIRCWTIDQCEPNYPHFRGAWLINFQNGEVSQAYYRKGDPEWGRYRQNTENYVKAVRSVK
jgi:serine/threonine-protein kinase